MPPNELIIIDIQKQMNDGSKSWKDLELKFKKLERPGTKTGTTMNDVWIDNERWFKKLELHRTMAGTTVNDGIKRWN